MKYFVAIGALSLSFVLAAMGFIPNDALAASAKELERDARTSLNRLYEQAPAARDLSKRAKGILIFPSVVKAGLMVGGQSGLMAGVGLQGNKITKINK
ncbi:MAG TPA: hypothetical protein VD839_11290 [Burkholderiales bacterium]|jgi:lipid-binding SYLF domain-containing protein|nr:hypothetical protein [Burkholderiales bacterium]